MSNIELTDEIKAMLFEEFKSKIYNEIKNQVISEIKQDEVQTEIKDETKDEVQTEIKDETKDEVQTEIKDETKDEVQKPIIKHDLGDGLSYYEEDGICYIDVDKDDEVIDEVRAKIVKASEIREFIKNGEFEKIKPYVPEDAFNILYNEYKKFLASQHPKTIPKEYSENINKLRNLLNKLNVFVKTCADYHKLSCKILNILGPFMSKTPSKDNKSKARNYIGKVRSMLWTFKNYMLSSKDKANKLKSFINNYKHNEFNNYVNMINNHINEINNKVNEMNKLKAEISNLTKVNL